MKGGINTQNQVLAPAQAHPPPGTFVETFSQGTRTTDPKARQPQGDTLKRTEGHGRPALDRHGTSSFHPPRSPNRGWPYTRPKSTSGQGSLLLAGGAGDIGWGQGKPQAQGLTGLNAQQDFQIKKDLQGNKPSIVKAGGGRAGAGGEWRGLRRRRPPALF